MDRRPSAHYSYADNNPVLSTDPTGEATWTGKVPADLTAAEQTRIETDLNNRFRNTFGLTRQIMRLTNSTVWVFGGVRSAEYSKSLTALNIDFVDTVAKDALGQAQGANTIQVSVTKYEAMKKQNRAAAVIELEATIAHEMTHNFQMGGTEPLVKLRAKSVQADKWYSEAETGTRASAAFGAMTSVPATQNVEEEPYAYYVEGRLFADSYKLRNTLKGFQDADRWSNVYKAFYFDPTFFWGEAVWRTWSGGVESKLPPPAANLNGTEF